MSHTILLSGKRLALLDLLRREQGLGSGPATGIPRSSAEGPAPLSPGQESLLLLDRLFPGTPLYNLPFLLWLEGKLDVSALERSLRRIVERHDSLRLSFASGEGGWVQEGSGADRLDLARIDLSRLPEGARATAFAEQAAAEARRPFDLERGPLQRLTLFRLNGRRHALLVNLHHAIADAGSVEIYARELGEIYDAECSGRVPRLADPGIRSTDFARWQAQWLEGEEARTQLAAWKERLAGIAPLDLPTDHPRPAAPSFRRGESPLLLDSPTVRELSAVAREERATPFMTLLALFGAQLHGYQEEDAVLVGSPSSLRHHGELRNLIGFFVNLLPLTVDASGKPTFRELLARVREEVLEAFTRQDYPFERLVEELQPERDPGRRPLVSVTLSLGQGPAAPAGFGGLAVDLEEVSTGTAKFDLSLGLRELPSMISGAFAYSLDLFEPATVHRWARHFEALAAAVVREPGRRLEELPLLAGAERHQVLLEWNDTWREISDRRSVVELFEEQAGRAPEATAVLSPEESLTYAELERRSARLARLLRALGVGTESRVGLSLEPSARAVVAVLGILRAGGAFVPLDPLLPEHRLGFLVRDAGIAVAVAGPESAEVLARCGVSITPPEAEAAGEEPMPPVPVGSLAYVIYTSGSTGEPKGVLIDHRALAGYLRSADRELLGERVRCLPLITRLSFDAALKQLFVPLLRGEAIWIPGPEALSQPSLLLSGLAARPGAGLNCVPSLWRALLAEVESGGAPAPRDLCLLLGGEALDADLLERSRAALPGLRVWNLYGPTEATANAAWGEVGGPGRCPIGRPLANVRAHVASRRWSPVPLGVPGELWVGGDGVARGYLGRPAATAERFIPDPWSPVAGARLYRTGDLVRSLPDGRLEYLGRRDHQVKVRGFRVEPGEIEAVLTRHPGVEQAAVLPLADASGALRLVACVTPAGPAAPTAADLRPFLAGQLPDYMLPSSLLLLEKMPLTATGKLDRRGLARAAEQMEEEGRPVAGSSDGAGTPAEEILCGVWADLLGCEAVGPHDDFFELGGHSLLAIRAMSRVRALFGVDLPLQSLFAAPNVAGLAAAVEAARSEGRGLDAPPLVPVPREGELPLSFAQQRLWLLHQMEPDSPLYNVSFGLHLEGDLDHGSMAGAMSALVARHEVLRTRFEAPLGSPRQVICPAAGFLLPVVDLADLPEARRQEGLRRLSAETARRPFDLERGPLLRLVMARLGAREHVLLVSMHHIASDAWSARVFLRDLSVLYGAALARPARLPGLPVQYADYAVWQRCLEGERLESELAYWRQRLAGLPPLLELPLDRPRPAVQTHAGRHERFRLEPSLVERLRPLRQREGATLFMTFLAAFQVLLNRHTGREDVAVGTPIAGRGRIEVEDLIGFFLNTLVIRAEVDRRAGFRELLRRVREVALEAYAHQELPFERLVEELQPERSLSHSPLFQTMFVLQEERWGDLGLPGLRARLLPFESGTSKFDLTLSLSEKDEGLHGTVEYNADLFDATTIRRLVGHWAQLLDGIAEDPDLPVSRLPLLNAAERRQLVAEWNDTAAPRGIRVVHRFFERQAERTPDAVALVFGNRRLTYREVEEWSNRLAHLLISLGVEPESCVGICVERSIEMLVGTLAALKAGGTCVPLDPAFPADRLDFMMRESDARVLLTQAALAASLPEHEARIVLLDGDDGPWAGQPARAPRVPVEPEHLVYAIYTSGSTGRPKGVGLPHGALANLIEWYLLRYPPDLRTLQFASLSFDVSYMETFATWGGGGTLVVAAEELRRDPASLASFLAKEGIERVTLPVLILQQLGQIWGAAGSPPSLREIASTGEQLQITPPVVELFGGRPDLPLHNLYGPSESHVVTTFELGPEPRRWPSHPSIGRPVANTRIHLLDPDFEPVPVGVVGELYIGGANLARGYLQRPDLTAEKFVPDPLNEAPGARLYRTGDLARHLPGGDIEFLGRADHQLKIRGFRVEAGEVEAVLTSHPGVLEAVVLALEDAPGERRLVAWLVPRAGAVPAAELRAWMRQRLPDYMVPSAFVLLDALPLTPNRKLDRKALPRPERARAEARRPPQTPVEEVVAGIWCEVLRLDEVGRDESFFELGGHSLLATQVTSRLRAVFGAEVPLRHFFESPTVEGLASRVESSRKAAAPAAPPIVPRPRTGALPLSFSQERLLFFREMGGSRSLFNLSTGFHLRGPLDAAVLDRSLCEIVRRHEVLRTAFSLASGSPVQTFGEPPATLLRVTDLRHVAAGQREASAQVWVEEEAWRPFELERAPQIRAGLLHLDEQDNILLITTHHLVFDGWSTAVLLRELQALYQAFSQGEPSPLEEPTIQYADFAAWQRERLQGELLDELLGWWRSHLDGAPPTLLLPADRPRPAVQTHGGGKRSLALPQDVREALAAVCRREGVSLFMGLLAAFAALLHRASGQDDVVVGTPIANRNRAEIEKLIGVFINNLALRVSLEGNPCFRDLLRQVRETTLGAYDHQDLPFERLVEELRPARDLSRTPVFQVMFALQNAPEEVFELPGVTPGPLRSSTIHAQFDLTLWMTDWRQGLGYFNYNTDLFDFATIERMSGQFQRLLAAAVADPRARIRELPLLAPAESFQVLAEWNDTRTAVEGACIHRLFEARAAASPEAVAVVFEGISWTWRDLNRRANRIARRLCSLGIGPEDRVGISMQRSPAMLAGLLGILKAGAAYLPLDPSYPRERLALMLDDSRAAVLLTQERLRGRLPETRAHVLAVDGEIVFTEPKDDANVDGDAGPENLAYVIYTSGSTGRPKGVLVRHDGAANFFAGMDERVGAGPGDTWLAVTSISFDISVLELLWTLTRGVRVVLRGEESAWSSALGARSSTVRPLEFSLFYFASDEAGTGGDKYRLLFEGARFADRHGFKAVWTPERHFHAFGGLYPNPSVTSAALAAITERVHIRAGSVVLPLQSPVRVAEEWSVVDHMSNGRVAISFASGWHADDFVLAPDNYRDRKAVMMRDIDTVRRLWRGESVRMRGGAGNEVEVRIRPRPVQAELPVWITAASSPETARMAGEIGAGLLTHLLAQTVEDLAATIAIYRESWRAHGHPGEGHVTLMIHTFLGDDLESVRETVRRPFYGYLESSLDLINNLMRSIGRTGRPDELADDEREALLAFGFDRYFPSLSLMGTPATAMANLERLSAAGVDEVACLIDFGVELEATLASLERVAAVRDAWERRAGGESSIAAQITRHGVTHLQSTPSMAEMLVADPEAREALRSLSALLLGGEALPVPLARRLREQMPGRILNMYGPTETTVWSAVSAVEEIGPSIPIGRPIANTGIYLLDRHLQPVPAGVTGELHIGGRGLARGYGDRPGLTAERFIPDPWSGEPGARLYRTGDLARHRADGSLELLGRADHQVKIRGHRIELGEIEAALNEHPLVQQGAVVAREDGAGDRRLVAYYLPAEDGLRRLQPVQAAQDRKLFILPNGMPVVSLSDFQTFALYKEIFEKRQYARHGITFDDGACIFDVGANVGFFTLFAHCACRNPRVFSFEPIPPTFATLKANVELYGLDVQLMPMGLGEREDVSRFTFYPHMPGLSGRHAENDFDRNATRTIMDLWVQERFSQEDRAHLSASDLDELLEGQLASETYDCRVRTVSDVIAEHGIERIDILKVDVERSEVEVLQGIRDEDWPKIRQVVLEVDTVENLDRVLAVLHERGFHCWTRDLITVDAAGNGTEVYVAMVYARRSADGADATEEDGYVRREVNARDLRVFLAERLPEPMVPSAFVRLDALPLTPNGKLDRRALPEPERAESEVEAHYVAPGEGLENRIAGVWRELLRLERVGSRDNFFELGGSSLLVVRVRNRLQELLGRDLSLVDLFRHPTIASLAAHLAAEGEGEAGASAELRERIDKQRSARARRRRAGAGA